MTALERIKHIYRYRLDPVEHLIRVLGVRRETLLWSTLPEYEGHEWDSKIWLPGDETPRDCVNPIATFLRAWAWGYPKIAIASAVGTQKCVRGDTLIPTSNGVVRADSLASKSCPEVHTSFDVYGAEGPEPAGKAFYEGEQEAWEVTTKQGFRVAGSKHHRVAVMK